MEERCDMEERCNRSKWHKNGTEQGWSKSSFLYVLTVNNKDFIVIDVDKTERR